MWPPDCRSDSAAVFNWLAVVKISYLYMQHKKDVVCGSS